MEARHAAMLAQLLSSERQPARLQVAKAPQLHGHTLADWVGRAAWFLRPLRERLLDHLRASPKLIVGKPSRSRAH